MEAAKALFRSFSAAQAIPCEELAPASSRCATGPWPASRRDRKTFSPCAGNSGLWNGKMDSSYMARPAAPSSLGAVIAGLADYDPSLHFPLSGADRLGTERRRRFWSQSRQRANPWPQTAAHFSGSALVISILLALLAD